MNRPFGVILLAVLSAVSGLWGLLKGLALLGLGGALATFVAGAHPVAGAVIGGLAVVFGVTTLLIGLFALVFAWGAWTLRPWAWTIGVWTHGITLVLGLLALLRPHSPDRWGSILISAIVLFYLTTPEIKRAFGKG